MENGSRARLAGEKVDDVHMLVGTE